MVRNHITERDMDYSPISIDSIDNSKIRRHSIDVLDVITFKSRPFFCHPINSNIITLSSWFVCRILRLEADTNDANHIKNGFSLNICLCVCVSLWQISPAIFWLSNLIILLKNDLLIPMHPHPHTFKWHFPSREFSTFKFLCPAA